MVILHDPPAREIYQSTQKVHDNFKPRASGKHMLRMLSSLEMLSTYINLSSSKITWRQRL